MPAEPTMIDVTRPARIPAWLLSLVLHLVLLVVLGLALRAAAPAPPEEIRTVGIVLAHRQPGARVEYADAEAEQNARAAAGSGRPHPAEATSEATADGRNAPLGTWDPSSLLIPDIRLPGSGAPVGSPDGLLVHDMPLGGGNRRSLFAGLDDDAILAEEAARRAARRSLGPTTQISLFGSAPVEGHSFVFAIDRSKSMGGDGLDALSAARVELARGLAHLRPNHQFQIIGYHHKAVYYRTTRLIPATEDNLAGVPAFIDQLAAFGGTSHEMAVRAALAMEPDAIFLLTDGGDPHLNEIELTGIRKLAAGRTSIHCIQFGFGPPDAGENFMMRLARQNRGSYTYVDMSQRRAR